MSKQDKIVDTETEQQQTAPSPARAGTEDVSRRLDSIEQRLGRVENYLTGVATKADLDSRPPDPGMVGGPGNQLDELAARMRTFLDKYVPHEQPTRIEVAEVVRDPQGMLRNRQGDVVPYTADNQGVLYDRGGTKIKVVESFFSPAEQPGTMT